MVSDLLALTTNDPQQMPQPGQQTHQIRKVSDENGKRVLLAIFLCFAKQSQFCIVRPKMVHGQYQLHHIATIYAPEVTIYKDRLLNLMTLISYLLVV